MVVTVRSNPIAGGTAVNIDPVRCCQWYCTARRKRSGSRQKTAKRQLLWGRWEFFHYADAVVSFGHYLNGGTIFLPSKQFEMSAWWQFNCTSYMVSRFHIFESKNVYSSFKWILFCLLPKQIRMRKRHFSIIQQPVHCAVILHSVTFLFLTAWKENIKIKREENVATENAVLGSGKCSL